MKNLREKMVSEQLAARGIKDERVLQAMREVPRELIVDEAMRQRAYEDSPLPIGYGQTISQPYMVARVCEVAQLKGHETVLDVGTGSGYQAAVLSRLCAKVYGIEIRPELAERAQNVLRRLECTNVEVTCGDGSAGWNEHAPYDAIIVAAGAPQIPGVLIAQLTEGGRLVIPVGTHQQQRLAVITRRGSEVTTEWTTPCSYVDLIGRYGFGGAGAGLA
jgi:protein-L-isoaspartate(D-aspartate) O-methyltransferase